MEETLPPDVATQYAHPRAFIINPGAMFCVLKAEPYQRVSFVGAVQQPSKRI